MDQQTSSHPRLTSISVARLTGAQIAHAAPSVLPSPSLSDQIPVLLAQAAAGSPQAWRSLVDLYARRVFALAHSRLGRGAASGNFTSDAAEEVTQSVFATVAAKLSSGEYTEQGCFEAWLFRITMNRIRDEARRCKRHAHPTDPHVLADQARTTPHILEDNLERASLLSALREALQQLPDPDREIIELRHHAQMSFKEIAETLAEPLGTLLARHHRALRKLKELLAPGFFDADQ